MSKWRSEWRKMVGCWLYQFVSRGLMRPYNALNIRDIITPRYYRVVYLDRSKSLNISDRGEICDMLRRTQKIIFPPKSWEDTSCYVFHHLIPSTAGHDYIWLVLFLVSFFFKLGVEDTTWHQSTKPQNRWSPFSQIWIIFAYLKL